MEPERPVVHHGTQDGSLLIVAKSLESSGQHQWDIHHHRYCLVQCIVVRLSHSSEEVPVVREPEAELVRAKVTVVPSYSTNPFFYLYSSSIHRTYPKVWGDSRSKMVQDVSLMDETSMYSI